MFSDIIARVLGVFRFEKMVVSATIRMSAAEAARAMAVVACMLLPLPG